jgi:hypothetical protein
MRISESMHWTFGRWDKCLSYRDRDTNIIYVFTDISHRRFDAGKYKAADHKRSKKYKRSKNYKIAFVTNKQLMDFSMPYADKYFMQDVRQLVFDGKFGTTYESKREGSSSCGSYFSCLRSGNYQMERCISRKISH